MLWLIVAAIVIYYATSLFTKTPHIVYPAFGIKIPQNYWLHGIDVSRYQKVINWGHVKDMQVENIKIGFAFIKATDGVDNVDPQFRRNWLKAEKEKIPKGAYHYFIAGKSGNAQADNFIEIVKLKKGDLPPVLDIEATDGASANELKHNVKEWLQKVEEHYKVRPIIYSNIYFYNKYLRGNFAEYPLWIAHYLQPDKPRIDIDWVFWQHSESGRVNGIRTAVDFNVFSGDSTQFKNLLIQ